MADTVTVTKNLGVIVEGKQNQDTGGLKTVTKVYELPNPKDDLTEQIIRDNTEWLKNVALNDPKFDILKIQGAAISGAYVETKNVVDLDLTGA